MDDAVEGLAAERHDRLDAQVEHQPCAAISHTVRMKMQPSPIANMASFRLRGELAQVDAHAPSSTSVPEGILSPSVSGACAPGEWVPQVS